MNKTEYREYLSSPEWQERRKGFLSFHTECERCSIPRWLAEIAYDQDLNVHHKSYTNIGNEDWEDLEALCRRCHEIEKFGRSDLREPKSSICEKCDIKHWNPYSQKCESCNRIQDQEPCCQCGHLFTPTDQNFLTCSFCSEMSNNGCDRAFYSFDLKHPHHKLLTVGEHFIILACIHYEGIDNILDIIAKNEKTIKLAIKILDSKSVDINTSEIEAPF